MTHKGHHGLKMISKAGRFVYVDDNVMCLNFEVKSSRSIVFWGYSTLLEISDLSADTSRMKEDVHCCAGQLLTPPFIYDIFPKNV